MSYAKLVVVLFVSLLLMIFVTAEEIISNDTNTSNVTLVDIQPVDEITTLPVEETLPPVEETIVVQPIEESIVVPENPVEEVSPVIEVPIPVEETPVIIQPIEEPAPVENSSDAITGSLVIEPVVEPSIMGVIVELILEKLSVIRGQIVELTAYLSYGNETPIPEKEVTFYVGDEKLGSDLTDETGKAQFFWNTSPFGPNVYAISVEYADASDGKNVVIKEQIPTNESMLTAAVVVEPVVEPQASGPVEEIQECVTIPFQEKENVYGTCTEERLECSGPDNSTCATVEKQYSCKTGEQMVSKSYQECKKVGLRVNNGEKIIELDIREYACSSQESGTQIIVTCDSKYDGNGDGICRSGESCQRIVVNGTTITKSEKNSDEEYREADDSYFMPEVGMEIIQ